MTAPDCIGEADHAEGARLTRELWGAVLHALRSGGPAVRERVAASIEAIGPLPWRADLRMPGLPARRLVDIGLPNAENLPDREQARPRIPRTSAGPAKAATKAAGQGRDEGGRR